MFPATKSIRITSFFHIIFYLCNCQGSNLLTDILDESVLFIPIRNLVNFYKYRDKRYVHHLVWYCVHSAPCYTGVEYCLFVLRLTRAPDK